MDDLKLIDLIWEALPKRATRKTRTALTDLRTALKGRQDPVSLALTKDPGATWDSDQIEALVITLLDDFAANGQSKLVMGIFRTVVARWCQLTGHDCPAPPLTFSKKRAKHPRRYGLVRALRERNRLREALGKALRAVKKGPDPHETDWLALMILSGLCHFQWLHRDTILGSIEACANPGSSLLLVNQRVALWYGLPLSGDPHAEQRITILDSLTAVLCLRTTPEEAKAFLRADDLSEVSPADRKALSNRLAQRLNAILSKHAPQMKPMTLDQLIRSCSVAAYNWLSPAVVSYLKREYVSGSTPPWVLARMEHTVQLLQVHEVTDHPATTQAESAIRPGGRESNESDEAGDRYMPKWSSILIEAMADDKRTRIRTALGLIQKNESLPRFTRLLAEFGPELIAVRGSKTNDPGTLRIYMRLLLRFLAPQFDQEDVIGMDIGDLQERYQDACDDFVDSSAGNAPSSRSRFIFLLLRWHDFLKDKYGVEELEDFSPFVAGALPIDANMVSLEEFDRFLSAILKSGELPQQEKVAGVLISVMGILGARRSEALYLLPEDVDSEHVLLRRNRFRTLKTRNALRRILLALLPRKIGKLLFGVLKRQRGRGRDTLFSTEQGASINEERFFQKLLEILRESCQDSTLRFHTLRHTAATLATVGLLCEDTTPIGELLPSLTRSLELLGNGAALRKAIYGTHEIHWCDLISVATYLGHGSARATTLPHYSHGLFLAHAAGILSQKDLVPLPRELALASGKGASAYRKVSGPESIEAFLFQHRFSKQIAAVQSRQAEQKRGNGTNPVEDLSDIERGLACAARIIAEPVSIQKIAEEFKMSIEDVAEIQKILAEIYGAEDTTAEERHAAA